LADNPRQAGEPDYRLAREGEIYEF
jgi:hypothetical protein